MPLPAPEAVRRATKGVQSLVAPASKNASLLWDLFVVSAQESGAQRLQQMATDLWRKLSYAKTATGTKQFLASFSKNLKGRNPQVIWGAFAQQDWSRKNLEHVASALKNRWKYPDLSEPVRQNFARAATLLASTKNRAADDEIRFIKETLAKAKTGQADKGAIAKARDLARLHGMHADFRELETFDRPSLATPILIGIGVALPIGFLLFRKG